METTTDLNIIVNDLSISYTDEGVNNRTTLIFIHGFPLDKEMWNSQRDALMNIPEWSDPVYRQPSDLGIPTMV